MQEIQNAIDACNLMVVVLSPNSVESEYVESEYYYARQQKKLIIPVLLAPCKVPMILGILQIISFEDPDKAGSLASLIKAITAVHTS